MSPSVAPLVAEIAERLRPAGIDLVQPLNAAWYDAAVAAEYRLPSVGRPQPLAIVLASTAAFWAPFLARLCAEPARLDDADPVDRYTEQEVRRALAGVALRHEVRFSSDPPPRRVAMQRLAHVSGLAAISPGMLCVHPVFGPWIALRGVVVLDADGPDGHPPAPPPVCGDCTDLCKAAFDRALAVNSAAPAGDPSAQRGPARDPVVVNSTLWLAVRDACPIGREHRYPDELIRYLYTKDRAVLRDAVRTATAR